MTPASSATARGLTRHEWISFVLVFAGVFLMSLSRTDGVRQRGLDDASWWVGIGLLAIAALLLGYSVWSRRQEHVQRTSWTAFERALPRGVLLDVPDGMSYAPQFPALLEGLNDLDAPRLPRSGAQARHAVLGEQGPIRFSAFEHHAGGAVHTIGLVSLRHDRSLDVLPDLSVTLRDQDAAEFDERFVVEADPVFADQLLGASARAVLMSARPFGWQVIGNQLLTVRDGSSTPEQLMTFIQERLRPLAEVAAIMPPEAGTSPGRRNATGE